MSNPPPTHGPAEDEVRLNLIPGSGDAENNNSLSIRVVNSTEQHAASSCKDENHRKLAICSIICGISCIGILALIYSVKAEDTTGQAKAEYSQQAKKFGIISIVTWVAILALTPMLMALISYLLTLQD